MQVKSSFAYRLLCQLSYLILITSNSISVLINQVQMGTGIAYHLLRQLSFVFATIFLSQFNRLEQLSIRHSSCRWGPELHTVCFVIFSSRNQISNHTQLNANTNQSGIAGADGALSCVPSALSGFHSCCNQVPIQALVVSRLFECLLNKSDEICCWFIHCINFTVHSLHHLHCHCAFHTHSEHS